MMPELNQSQLYDKALSLHRDAKQHHDLAITQLCKPVSYDYRDSSGARADQTWLETLRRVSTAYYDRTARLRRVVQSLTADANDLETLAPMFMGVRVETVRGMAAEARKWATELETRADATLLAADEWQARLDEWERMLMTEDADEREARWEREYWEARMARDAREAEGVVESIAEDAGYASVSDWMDSQPD